MVVERANFSLTSYCTKRMDSLPFPIESRMEQRQGALRMYKEQPKETEMKKWIDEIRAMFESMTDGAITKSPYDTAWVAMVPAFDDSDRPQFPKSLQWILDNQLPDGSWGDSDYFSYCDRVCNTVACIVSLKTWKAGSGAVKRGVEFIQRNLQALETEEQAHMTIGFEIVFPALMCFAQKLELDLPYDATVMLNICTERQKKLENIPMDILHEVPTALLYSLEGLHQEVDWGKLLKMQNEDGSFLSSPAATAACLLHTRDEKALRYLNRLLGRFNNAVPNVYPVDLFERIWIVDRLERLGIARYFEKEIKDCLQYVYKYFTSTGIAWARQSRVHDLDDTSMGFRVLRQHGYDVNENVFAPFRGKDDDFFSFVGQNCESVTTMFNLYRAAQTRFPGETLLEAGEKFSRAFLADKLEKNECFDKWIISKGLAGEVEYALETPWYCSVPLVDTAAYLDHYGPDDIWIGKSLYRLPLVHNMTFLALAKANFNLCQAMYQLDLEKITRWTQDSGLVNLSFARQRYIEVVFSAACAFPAPELAPARWAWARMCVMTTLIDDYFEAATLTDQRKFVAAAREWDPSLMDGTTEESKIVFYACFNTINAMTEEGTFEQGHNIGQRLQKIWYRYLESHLREAEWTASGYWPSFDEYLKIALISAGLEATMLSSLYFLREPISDELFEDLKQLQLMGLVNRVGRLMNDIHGGEREKGKVNAVSILLLENMDWTEEEAISHIRAMVESSMLELVREVYQQSHIPESVRHVHFNAVRILRLFYQIADGYTNPSFMAKKVKSILFQPVLSEVSEGRSMQQSLVVTL
uniref:Kolavenol synthase n=1 Tax=Odontoschisma prostratum TaxID=526359 RepID=A0A8U0DBN3_9MARC|nr:kolavenol synthase [Odontoschisma prostratum]